MGPPNPYSPSGKDGNRKPAPVTPQKRTIDGVPAAAALTTAVAAHRPNVAANNAPAVNPIFYDYTIRFSGTFAAENWSPIRNWMNNPAFTLTNVFGEFKLDKEAKEDIVADFQEEAVAIAGDESEDEDDLFQAVGENDPIPCALPPKVQQLWGLPLSRLEIFELTPLSELAPKMKNEATKPFTLIGMPKLVRNDTVVNVNNVGDPLVKRSGNHKEVNPKYFYKNIQFRSNGKHLKIAIQLESYQWNDQQKLETQGFREECLGLARSPFFECGTGKDLPVVRSTMWDGYAVVIAKIFQIPIVQKGLACGFYPVLLFKNLAAQLDNNKKITLNSCDHGALTSIYLIGFQKGYGEKAKVISLCGTDGAFLTKPIQDNARTDIG